MRFPPWLLTGLLGGVIGGIIGYGIYRSAVGGGYEVLPVYAGIAAFVCSSGFWWLILDRPQKYTVRRGTVAGALAGALAHYLCWYLIILGMNACYWITRGCTSTLGEAPVDPFLGLAAAFTYSLFSLIFYGWLTIPTGAVTAGILAAAFRKYKTSRGGSTCPD